MKNEEIGVFSPQLYILYSVSPLFKCSSPFGLAAAPVSGERFASDAVILVTLRPCIFMILSDHDASALCFTFGYRLDYGTE